MIDTVQTIYYNHASDVLRRDIAVMLSLVWPDVCPMPGETIPDAHDPALHTHSFYSYSNSRLVSYTGVVRKTIKHSGQTFNIGLSCVSTHPDYRGRGLGLRTVATATRWIEEQADIDFGLFL